MSEVITEIQKTTHHPFGPSSLERRFLCPGSYQVESLLKDIPGGEDAKRGSRIHEAAENWILEASKDNGSPDSIFEKMVPEEAEIAKKIASFVMDQVEYHEWSFDMLKPELRLSYSSFLGEEYYGTSDLVVIDDEMIYIYDWKTGYREVTEAENNWQGAAYALAAMQMFKKKSCQVTFFNPTIMQHTSALFDDASILASEIMDLIGKCKAENAPCVPGEKQCKYCKGAICGTCPVYLAERQSLIAVSESTNTLPISEIPDESLAELYKKCKIFDKFQANVEAELRVRIKKNGCCACYEMKETSGGREARDVNGIYEAVREYFGPEEFMGFCTVSIAKLSKEYAKKVKDCERVKTEKDGKALFDNITAEFVTDKPPRMTLVEKKE